MHNPKRYKILLIEPSEIVSAGIAAIISQHPEYTIAQTASSLAYHNVQNCDADIIIINPAVIDYNERLASISAGRLRRYLRGYGR